jgi:hypothetical protein
MKTVIQNSFPTSYTTPNVTYIQQCNYPYCKEIVFSTFMTKEFAIPFSDKDSSVVAVFTVRLKSNSSLVVNDKGVLINQ